MVRGWLHPSGEDAVRHKRVKAHPTDILPGTRCLCPTGEAATYLSLQDTTCSEPTCPCEGKLLRLHAYQVDGEAAVSHSALVPRVLPGRERLSGWIVILGYCAMRVRFGTDPSVVANRVCFIEKTPRVRVPGPGRWLGCEAAGSDAQGWWIYGPKGRGCTGDETPEQEEAYGFYPPSRAWCEEMLRQLGYDVPLNAFEAP